MTPRELCTPGKGESLKLSVHAALGLLSGICAGYNLAAYAYRRERHSALNAALYVVVTIVELSQVSHHLESR